MKEADYFQAFDVAGVKYCGARLKTCSKCKHRYVKAEYELRECPECGHDRRCKKAIKNFPRCDRHGGGSRRGQDHYRFGTGEHSKYAAFPPVLRSRLAAIEADPDLHNFSTERNVIIARMQILAERLHTGESGSLWKALGEAWPTVLQAIAGHDPVALRDAIRAVDELLKLGQADELAWRDLCKATYDVAHFKQLEHKRLLDMQATMTADQAATFALAVMNAVDEEVEDKTVKARIGMRLHRLMNMPERASSNKQGLPSPSSSSSRDVASRVVEGRAERVEEAESESEDASDGEAKDDEFFDNDRAE